MMKPVFGKYLFYVMVVVSLIAAGCSDDGDSSLAGGGIGGTGITTSGTITGFGSVFVNGIEFETSGSAFDVDDDDSASEADLDIGMVVKVVGSVNDDGVSGTADSITYDDEFEGPIAGLTAEDPATGTRSFSVFGTTIIVDRNPTVFEGTDFDSLANNDLVEVSGFFDAAGALHATRLEKVGEYPADTRVEITGTVTGFNGTDTFTLGSATITFDGTTDLSELPGGAAADGQYVEVEGVLTSLTAIDAARIELEDKGFDDTDDEVSIEGLVTDFVDIDNFRVAGQAVDASGAGFSPARLESTIGNGDRVEVEGPIQGGILQAEEVEQRGGEVKIRGMATNVNLSAGTVTVEVVSGQSNLVVATDTQTEIEDERDGQDNCLLDTMIGVELRVETILDNADNLVATQIRCDENLDKYQLRGPADVPPTAGNSSSGTVSILGVSIATDFNTDFARADETAIIAETFYSTVVDGDLIKFEYDPSVDNIADEVEFEEE